MNVNPDVAFDPVTFPEADDGLFHWECCVEEVSYCGKDVSNLQYCTPHEPTCGECQVLRHDPIYCPVRPECVHQDWEIVDE